MQKGRPRKRKSPALGVDIVNYNSGGCSPHPGRPLLPQPWVCPENSIWLLPYPLGLQEGAFPQQDLPCPQLSVTQKLDDGVRVRGRREKGDGEGRGRKGERHLYFVCGQKYNSQPWGSGDFPQTRQGINPCCPLVNEPISFWLPSWSETAPRAIPVWRPVAIDPGGGFPGKN